MKEYKFRVTMDNLNPYFLDIKKICAAGTKLLGKKEFRLEQLIAKDANGVDVYEGDKIQILGWIDDEGTHWNFKQTVIVTAQMVNLEEIESGLAVAI